MRREQIVDVPRAAMEPLAFVNLAWLGGSDAFSRADVDLEVDTRMSDGKASAESRAVDW